MTIADPEAAVRRVDEFIIVVEETFERWNQGQEGYGPHRFRKVKELLPIMREIARAVDHGIVEWFQPSGKDWPWTTAHDGAIRLRSLILAKDELHAMLGPIGPRLDATGLHSWVWSAAAGLWDNGHFRSALQAAGAQIEAQLQAKLDRYEVSGGDLVTQAFTREPAQAGRSRLRIPGFRTESENYRNAQDGARYFGVGCMSAIRNIASHTVEEPDEAAALEQLAALSVLARWIDDATLETL